ncbi:MAG: hypothetical protein V4650_02235 [Pseudomonadota bacterium]
MTNSCHRAFSYSSYSLMFLAALGCAACGNSVSSGQLAGSGSNGGGGGASSPPLQIDRRCDTAAFPSATFTECEAVNFAMNGQAAAEQLSPIFQQRWNTQSLTNTQSWLARAAADASWLSPTSGNTALLPLCATWAEQCVGDPFRYQEAVGADGDHFYNAEAEVMPFVYYDEGCARQSGRVWAPKGSRAGDKLPAVVVENGSVQAPETVYWWAAQALVRAGYVVMSFDPRGQGRSDQQTPTGSQGSNANISVFTTGLVNAIDFFRSSSVQPYPHNLSCQGTYATAVTDFNPYQDRVDPGRLGIAGHSAGAIGVTVVQGYGAPGASAWPGRIDSSNPVKVAVAWDGATNPNLAGGGAGSTPGVGAVISEATTLLASVPAVLTPRVPFMSQTSEYGLVPVTYSSPPDIESHKAGYRIWQAASVPVVEFTIRGSSHYEWSILPTFPATSWCPQVVDGRCVGGWGRPMAEHYTVAWFDRYLKNPGETGYADADDRLLDDTGEQGANKMSYHFRSARAFIDRTGKAQICEDIRAGC